MPFFLAFFSALFLDQVTKALAISFLPYSLPVPLIPSFLYFTLTANTGAAFGIFREGSSFLLLFNLFFLVVLFYFFPKIRRESSWLQVSLGLIAGGALGNIFDRLTYGRVVDFIDFRVWPVFNFADSFIVIGGALLVISLLLRERKS